MLRGRRFGNVVVLAAHHELPAAELTRRVAGGPLPRPGRAGPGLDAFTGGAAPAIDATAMASPEPPPSVFGTA